jgi:hypothetical protein
MPHFENPEYVSITKIVYFSRDVAKLASLFSINLLSAFKQHLLPFQFQLRTYLLQNAVFLKQDQFQKTYGVYGDCDGHDVHQTTDGRYIIRRYEISGMGFKVI